METQPTLATLRFMPELTASEWIEVGVAIGTALLALATFDIVLAARQARLEQLRIGRAAPWHGVGAR